VPGVLLLRGSLGTGKTTLTRGVVEGLGVRDGSQVNSPSFTLVNLYHGRCPVYHVDLYRLSGPRDLRSIGLDDFLGREGVTVIEWSERLGYRVEAAIRVELEDAGNNKRRIRIILPPGIPELPALQSGGRSPVAGTVRKKRKGERRRGI
jgi:tRNA threonylcarbamoyl adenosine modification protein YjeE